MTLNETDRADKAVTHFESEPGRTACGRKLPTAGFFTEDFKSFEESGKPCRQCWRSAFGVWG